MFQKNYEKKNIYNLNEEDDLTHYGQSLADIEKLNDIVDSDSDTEERGILSGKNDQTGLLIHTHTHTHCVMQNYRATTPFECILL